MFKQGPPVGRSTLELTEAMPLGKGVSEKKVKIPLRALVHETGEFIQANCCTTPWCRQFGVPVGTELGEHAGVFFYFLHPVRHGKFDEKKPASRLAPQFECGFCGRKALVISNRSLSEVIAPLITKYAPAVFCRKCSEKGHNAESCENAYKWEYDDFDKDVARRVSNTSRTDAGNRRVRCKLGTLDTCARKSEKGVINRAVTVTSHRDFPHGKFGDFLKSLDGEKLVQMYHASFMTLNQFRRSCMAIGKIPAGRHKNPRLGQNVFYNALNWYHFLAVEWLGYYNNQIRQGMAKIAGAAAVAMRRSAEAESEKKAKERAEAKSKKKINAEVDNLDDPYLEMAEDETESANEFVEKSDAKKRMPDYNASLSDLPQVQTDTLVLSVATPGLNDKQQQVRLMISALAPSGYILLATTNFTDSHDVVDFLSLDRKTKGGNWAASRGRSNREYAMHAHLLRRIDCFKQSKRSHYLGTSMVPAYNGSAAMIRQPYHEFAHYYVLEKILRGIKGDILLSMDGEGISIRACLWAFRERIKRGECHVVQVSGKKKADILSPSLNEPVSDGMARLKNAVVERQQALPALLRKIMPTLPKGADGSEKAATGLEEAKTNFRACLKFSSLDYSVLAQRWPSKPPEHKKKTWHTAMSFVRLDAEDAAKILRTATLFTVDSVCNQMRQRLAGFYRGKLGARRDSHSYLSHWRIPIMLQRIADIFAFSKNCLAWHSLHKSYRPACYRLGLEKSADLHLQDYCAEFYTRNDFNEKKFGVCAPKDEIAKKGAKK